MRRRGIKALALLALLACLYYVYAALFFHQTALQRSLLLHEPDFERILLGRFDDQVHEGRTFYESSSSETVTHDGFDVCISLRLSNPL